MGVTFGKDEKIKSFDSLEWLILQYGARLDSAIRYIQNSINARSGVVVASYVELLSNITSLLFTHN